jgi:hypothetical protein
LEFPGLPRTLVLRDDFASGTAICAELDDVRLVLEETLEQIIRPNGPQRNDLEGVAIVGGSDLTGDVADFFVEAQHRRAGWIGGQNQNFDLVHFNWGAGHLSPLSGSTSTQGG